MKKFIYILSFLCLGWVSGTVFGQSTSPKPGVYTPSPVPGLSMEQTQELMKASYDAFYPAISVSYVDYWEEYCCGNVSVTHLGKGKYRVEYGGGSVILLEDIFI